MGFAPIGPGPFLEEVEGAAAGVEGGGLAGAGLADNGDPEDGALDLAAADIKTEAGADGAAGEIGERVDRGGIVGGKWHGR